MDILTYVNVKLLLSPGRANGLPLLNIFHIMEDSPVIYMLGGMVHPIGTPHSPQGCGFRHGQRVVQLTKVLHQALAILLHIPVGLSRIRQGVKKSIARILPLKILADHPIQ